MKEKDLVGSLISSLSNLRAEMIEAETGPQSDKQLDPSHAEDARNLLHYLALRRHDIRELQDDLASLGLSSLGRSEAHVLHTIDAVLNALRSISGKGTNGPQALAGVRKFREGRDALEQNTAALLGEARPKRSVRIMVTMPSEASTDYSLVRNLLKSGMNCMRINTAHDGQDQWAGMISNLRRAQNETGQPCKVLMDLAGPKIRTGPLQEEPVPVKWKPKRTSETAEVEPARIFLQIDDSAGPPDIGADAVIPIAALQAERLKVSDRLVIPQWDSGSSILTITQTAPGVFFAEGYEKGAVNEGDRISVCRNSDSSVPEPEEFAVQVAQLPRKGKSIPLQIGDTLELTREALPARRSMTLDDGSILQPARIACLPGEVLDSIKVGERVVLDDGKITGIVSAQSDAGLQLHITQCKAEPVKLRNEKGINFPDSDIRFEGLTDTDENILPFVAENADMVGLSFVQRGEDIEYLQRRLKELNAPDLGLVLKIETRKAFEHLPELLLAAMRSKIAGVMIARGDLAVESGFERMAEVQEEILWISEAARMPVIWATQVLESMAQTGIPSRAEITDAAMGVRAECVMLNKGPHVVDAVRTLDDILTRMQDHQKKKSSRLRELHSWYGAA